MKKRNKVEVPVEVTARILNDIIKKEYFEQSRISAFKNVLKLIDERYNTYEIEEILKDEIAKLEKK